MHLTGAECVVCRTDGPVRRMAQKRYEASQGNKRKKYIEGPSSCPRITKSSCNHKPDIWHRSSYKTGSLLALGRFWLRFYLTWHLTRCGSHMGPTRHPHLSLPSPPLLLSPSLSSGGTAEQFGAPAGAGGSGGAAGCGWWPAGEQLGAAGGPLRAHVTQPGQAKSSPLRAYSVGQWPWRAYRSSA